MAVGPGPPPPSSSQLPHPPCLVVPPHPHGSGQHIVLHDPPHLHNLHDPGPQLQANAVLSGAKDAIAKTPKIIMVIKSPILILICVCDLIWFNNAVCVNP